jgi:hypothetical protein
MRMSRSAYAVPPNSQVQIMYHGIQGNDQWIALPTTVKDGEALAGGPARLLCAGAK